MSQYIVIGLGYVGINLLNSFQKKYSKIIGYDIDSEKIKQLNIELTHLMKFEILN